MMNLLTEDQIIEDIKEFDELKTGISFDTKIDKRFINVCVVSNIKYLCKLYDNIILHYIIFNAPTIPFSF